MQGSQGPNEHETVGAYALGILDDAEATAFETHLAGCEWCAQQLDELAGMEPMLAALADLPGAQGTPAIGESLSARPSPQLATRLVDEVAERRASKRRRSFYMVAAAAALIIGGPTAVFATTGGDTTSVAKPSPTVTTKTTGSAKDDFAGMTDRVSATDPTTKVTATVAMTPKAWGVSAVLELGGVKGPLKCSLIVVGKDGSRETMSNWSVPTPGYGIKDATTEAARNPLYIHGGTAFSADQIDHYEVVDSTGKQLVEVDA
ncbi:zf-HC2 domain-containing protein [Streptomyces sp. NBC_00576]|uniref:zf-HC2 domain-containing protein n=1 Tax=Streptomyces sp. NBC_00576 TaxID=2903665 RepID=UPI002E812D4C|nr:zf-HC2 domain-containing protein [Streptomyces sp. NBC_00576]WUB74022.1 zf-HC2 domain-containing protein [Streptomyces sp. NBC_00576]